MNQLKVIHAARNNDMSLSSRTAHHPGAESLHGSWSRTGRTVARRKHPAAIPPRATDIARRERVFGGLWS